MGRLPAWMTLVVWAAACGVRGPLRWEGAPAETARPVAVPGGPGAPTEGEVVTGAGEAPPAPSEEAERLFLRAVSDQGACRYGEAHAGFSRLLQEWPESPLAPEAMLRLGEVLDEPACPSHDPEAARAAWNAVVDRWPESTAASLARDLLVRAPYGAGEPP